MNDPLADDKLVQQQIFPEGNSPVTALVFDLDGTLYVNDELGREINLAARRYVAALKNVTPAEAEASVQDKIWSKAIDKNELEAYRSQMQVISSHMAEGKVMLHVYADSSPAEGFQQVTASLEDVYFSTITKN